MSGFWTRYVMWWDRNSHWVFAIIAALNLWAGSIEPSAWRWVWLGYAVFAAFVSGWYWQREARRRDMRRRHIVTVQGATWDDAIAFKDALEWFANERKAGRR